MRDEIQISAWEEGTGQLSSSGRDMKFDIPAVDLPVTPVVSPANQQTYTAPLVCCRL
jgi:hypothetical protein